MRAHIILAIVILVEILVLILGCQGDRNGPLSPSLDQPTGVTPGIGVEDETDSADHIAQNAPPLLWGYYEVKYDAGTHEIINVPLRGPSYAFNVIRFLQPPAGYTSGVSIGILDDDQFWQTGRIDVRVVLHHPFPGEPVYNGFDTYGVFITEGSVVSSWNSSIRYAEAGVDPVLLNPDGYTRWMNPTEFLSGDIFGYDPGYWATSESSENSGFVAGATLNPYKYFAYGFSPDETVEDWLQNPTSVDNRGMFPSGASCGRDYELYFPIVDDNLVYIFNYGVVSNWAEPANNPPEDPLSDFPPEANAGWAQHLIVTDRSECWYSNGESGGSVILDIELLDWDGIFSGQGIPGEVGSIVVWSDEYLIPGASVELMDTEVEWNSGFTASTSVATIEIPNVSPSHSGEVRTWLEIRSTNPDGYDQNFGVEVPDDPLAAYTSVMVTVKDCPKAGATEIDIDSAGSGEFLDDVVITGENFVEGSDLGAWLELIEAPGSANGQVCMITGTDVQYLDENTISCDFDLTNAPFGDYGLGCNNGCGITTTPMENFQINGLKELQVNLTSPINVELYTNRDATNPEPLETVTIVWQPVPDAFLYRIYARFYDINGNLVLAGSLFGTSNYPFKSIPVTYLPTGSSGICEFWVTACPDPTEYKYESNTSNRAYVYMQSFEVGMGQWELRSETTEFRFIRSVVDAAFDGDWGLKAYGQAPSNPGSWALVASPAISDVAGAKTAIIEFLHRHADINDNNGYQLGWSYDLPTDGDPTVESYYPVAISSYGEPYNDNHCPALQQEFGISPTTDNNFQSADLSWQGWYITGFDVSEILGDDLTNSLVIGVASQGFDTPGISIDDIAILVY